MAEPTPAIGRAAPIGATTVDTLTARMHTAGMGTPPRGSRHRRDSGLKPLTRVAVVGSLMFTSALIGIWSRPTGFLASFWIANALLIGLLVRFPRFVTWYTIPVAAAALVAADLLTGSRLAVTAWMTAANLIQVGVGYVLYRRLGDLDRRLARPRSVAYLFAIALVTAAIGATVGAGASPTFFEVPLHVGWGNWFAGELANMMAILPVILTLPTAASGRTLLTRDRETGRPSIVLPALVLALGLALGAVVGGPAVLAFPVPALLLCAVRCSVLETAFLTLVSSALLSVLVGLNLGALSAGPVCVDSTIVSVRIGLALIALGPLAVACENAGRRELLTTLRQAVARDPLTGALSRAGFLSDAAESVRIVSTYERHVTVLMIDLDDFKQTNDTHGHAAGDTVLEAAARTLQLDLRDIDVFGRMGGEEFAAVLPGINLEAAELFAERMRRNVADLRVPYHDDVLTATVSIGVAHSCRPPNDLPRLLERADSALYRAKSLGRNRVEIISRECP